MKALSKEVIATLLLKVLLLYVLWFVCFSHPVSKQLDKAQLTERLIGTNQVHPMVGEPTSRHNKELP